MRRDASILKGPAPSNYDLARDKGEAAFLRYSQEKMIRRFSLPWDDSFLYVVFLGRQYRINRHTGRVEGRLPETGVYRHSGFDEVMTILDVLCCSREGCGLAGEFVPISSVSRVVQSAPLGGGIFAPYASFFEHRIPQLERACLALGGGKANLPGDLAFRLDLFAFLPVVVQYWDSDDEFPPSLRVLWDRNILDFMRYETTYYAAGHLLRRLREEMERESGEGGWEADGTRRT